MKRRYVIAILLILALAAGAIWLTHGTGDTEHASSSSRPAPHQPAKPTQPKPQAPAKATTKRGTTSKYVQVRSTPPSSEVLQPFNDCMDRKLARTRQGSPPSGNAAQTAATRAYAACTHLLPKEFLRQQHIANVAGAPIDVIVN